MFNFTNQSAQKLIIKNFQPHQIPEDYETNCWNIIKATLDAIYHDKTPPFGYQMASMNCEYLIKCHFGHGLYNKVCLDLENYVEILALSIKSKLSHSPSPSSSSNSDSLLINHASTLCSEWKIFKSKSKLIENILVYLDRFYIVQKSELSRLMTILLDLYKSHIIQDESLLKKLYIESYLKLIDNQRREKRFNSNNLKHGKFDMEIDENENENENETNQNIQNDPFTHYLKIMTEIFIETNVFNSLIQIPFELETSLYYKELFAFQRNQLRMEPFPLLLWIKNELIKEESRLDLIGISPFCIEKIIHLVEQEIIVNPMNSILVENDGFSKLLDLEFNNKEKMQKLENQKEKEKEYKNENIQNDQNNSMIPITPSSSPLPSSMSLLYELCNRVNLSDSILKTHWNKIIKERGNAIIASAATSSSSLDSTVIIIEELLFFRDSLNRIVKESFANKSIFINTTKDALETVMNSHQNKSSELLARYSDIQLKSQILREENLESILYKIIVLFRLIQGKDIFEAYYKRYLAHRLLSSKSNSIEMERKMISLLKSECGSAFTSRLEGMFKDMDLNVEMMREFHQFPKMLRKKRGFGNEFAAISFEATIITSGIWPFPSLSNLGSSMTSLSGKSFINSSNSLIQSSMNIDSSNSNSLSFSLPLIVSKYQDIYGEFYKSQHKGRHLAWHPLMGQVVLKADFPLGAKELQVNIPQSLILLSFNDQDQLSLGQLREITEIPMEILKRTLNSLCQGSPSILVYDSNLQIVTFNEQFASSSFRIRINDKSFMGLFSNEIKEDGDMNENEDMEADDLMIMSNIKQDRQHLLDATIVRIMKTNRRMHQKDLVNEIFKELEFAMESKTIFERINNLIDREYISKEVVASSSGSFANPTDPTLIPSQDFENDVVYNYIS